MRRPSTFLAIGGPLNNQMITDKEAYEWKYYRYNRATGGTKAPGCVFIWPAVLSE